MNRNRRRAARELTAGERRSHFDALYATHQTAILGYVLRRAGSTEDAADAIADTFLVAWRRLDSIPPGEDARLWLYGTARRVLANQRRGERRRVALTLRLRAELIHAQHETTSIGAIAELSDAFKRLSESDREILALEGWEGLEIAQIAMVLGCSSNAARIRLHRARRRLAEQLEHQETEITTSDAHARPGEVT